MAKGKGGRRRRRTGRSRALASTQSAPPEGFPEENPNRPREYHGRRTMLAAAGVVGAVALALWLALGGGGSPDLSGEFGLVATPAYLNEANLTVAAETGALAPDFELETLDGQRFRLSDLRGHPTIVNFWASWCGPCRREMPALVRLAERYREAGLVIIGVNIEESRDAARRFANEFGVEFALPMDFGGGVTREYFRPGAGPPHTFFVGADGTIDRIFVGQGPEAAFEEAALLLLDGIDQDLGPLIVPGPKAVPTDLLVDGREVGHRIGEIAPDFVLATSTGGRWRLSDHLRLGPVLLAFAPPGCGDCDAFVTDVMAGADQASVEVAVVSEAGSRLLWQPRVAELFEADGDAVLVLVGADGVIQARGAALAEVQPELDRLNGAVAAGTPVS